jgi:hypothetical protein
MMATDLALIGLIGATALAAHQIALQIAAILFMAPFGIGMAATVRVGRGDTPAVRRTSYVATLAGRIPRRLRPRIPDRAWSDRRWIGLSCGAAVHATLLILSFQTLARRLTANAGREGRLQYRAPAFQIHGFRLAGILAKYDLSCVPDISARPITVIEQALTVSGVNFGDKPT